MNMGTDVDRTTTARSPDREPDWWHRDHPTFTALAGFFSGMVFVIVVPGAFAGLMRLLFDYETAEEFFPFVLLTLVVPITLLGLPRTRRYGKYFLLGMVLTAVVVVGVAALVFYLMVRVNR
jgi:hypothetical protein